MKLGKIVHLETCYKTTLGPAKLLTAVIYSKSQNVQVAQPCYAKCHSKITEISRHL